MPCMWTLHRVRPTQELWGCLSRGTQRGSIFGRTTDTTRCTCSTTMFFLPTERSKRWTLRWSTTTKNHNTPLSWGPSLTPSVRCCLLWCAFAWICICMVIKSIFKKLSACVCLHSALVYRKLCIGTPVIVCFVSSRCVQCPYNYMRVGTMDSCRYYDWFVC